MKYIIPINEYVGNEKLVKYYMKKILLFLDKLAENNLTSSNIIKRLDNYRTYNLELINFKIKHSQLKVIEKFILSMQKELLKSDYYLSYTIKKDYGTYVHDDLSISRTDEEYINVHLHTKNLYVSRVVPPEFIYHHTTKKHLESIKQNGLVCSSNVYYNETSLKYPPMLFFTTKPDMWEGDVTIKVSTKDLPNKFWKDLNICRSKEAMMTNMDVPTKYFVDIKVNNDRD